MPELPEMETYRRLLMPLIQGKEMTGVTVERPKSLNVEPELFASVVTGNRIGRVERRAKHLLFHLDSGHVLLLHLMLGGSMFFGAKEEKPDRTAQIEIAFGSRNLYFIGLRLGYLHLHGRAEEAAALLAKLGPEPLDPGFTLERFQRILRAKNISLKVALTDQSVLSGIGNCYSDEICFFAGLLPARKAASLTADELARLFESMLSVLSEAIRFGGYMDVPLYAGDRLTGQFDSMCRVYDREGEPCVRCGYPLFRIQLSSRKCFYCPNCQK